jgi:DNA-binding SARP family transcriptional activator/Flp pilus assembly protein TadD
MRYRILGPLALWDGRCWEGVSAAKQRALLAVLLLKANQMVPADWLVEQLWSQQPPAAAANQLQVYISRLRRRLDDRVGRVLVTHSPGYRLVVVPGELDLQCFEELLASGRRAARDGALERAAGLLGEALDLWRGPALADVPAGRLVDSEAARLEEARLAATQERLEVEMRLGRSDGLVGELQALVAEQPLRERLWGLLMVALYQSGRQAEALAAYSRARAVLVEELGVEPGAQLQRLQQQILATDPALDAPPRPARVEAAGPDAGALAGVTKPRVPRQLPADIAAFTGRRAELARLEKALGTAENAEPVVIAAIDGPPGIGKSALAIHAAHRLAGRFPDGQLYVDLQGASPGLAPLDPLEVLGRFLRALGVNGSEVPAGVQEVAAGFRSQVAGRRLLLVLDNAHDAAQVTALLPGTSGCGVLVTSRRLLGRLNGAHHLHLDVLSSEEAVSLLGRLAGQAQIATESSAAEQVARCCGYLPLALRIAGARLAARPAWPIAALAERLADARRRLDELELGDVGVRASLAVSYQELRGSADPLDRAAAGAFPALGMLEGPDLSVPVAARLLDQPEAATERVLERLVDTQLLGTARPGRYRMHDLLRLYAREQASQTQPQPERLAALGRALGFYVVGSWRSFALLRPGDQRPERADRRWLQDGPRFADTAAALDWLETERVNLVAAAAQAATIPGLAPVTVQLAHALFAFFLVRSWWQDWVRLNQTALQVAHHLGDRAAQAQVRNDLGVIYLWQGRYEEALACLQESLTLHRELRDRRGQGSNLGNLGLVYERQGRYEQALACHQENLLICRELGCRRGQAISLNNLGGVHERQGRYDDALACLRQSLAITDELGDPYGQAEGLGKLAIVHRRQGRYEDALACLQRSLAISQELNDPYNQSETLSNLGSVYRQQGKYAEALAYLRDSLALRQQLGDPYWQAETRRELGVTLQALGRHQQARAHLRQALEIFERLQAAEAAAVRALLDGRSIQPLR